VTPSLPKVDCSLSFRFMVLFLDHCAKALSVVTVLCVLCLTRNLDTPGLQHSKGSCSISIAAFLEI
jgi:hypothetical protein